jgi:hypothetical protein
VLSGVAEGRLRLLSGGESFELELEQIEKARLVPNFDRK